MEAAPPQRLIVQFKNPLSTEQHQSLFHKVESTLKKDITVLPHSTNQRWILLMDTALEGKDLEQALAELNKIDRIEYVEPDQVLGIQR